MAIVVVRGAASGFAQDVVIDQQHHLKADEPKAAGGTGTGPSPYDYVLVALGA
jgi:putative redox protein